jgi:hypothetical protein
MTQEEITNDIMDARADTVLLSHWQGVTRQSGQPLMPRAPPMASSRAKISTAPKDGVTRRSVTVPFSLTCQHGTCWLL